MANLRHSHTSHNNCAQNSMVEVTVIIPTLNEEKTIATCIQKIKKVFKEYNIKGEIIVSDSSTDKTPQIAKKLGAKVVHPDRRGYGYAYIYAFKHAKGKYIVMGDGDDTYDFLEMPRLLEPLMKDEADLVIGSRFKGRMERNAMPWLHRWIGNPILTWFLNLFFKAGVSDAHCGFRAIRRDALEKMRLRSHGMEFASEMIIEATRLGFRITEVPVNYYARKSGKSKLNSFSDGWRHLRFMLLHTPTWLFMYPGFFLLITGAILIASALLNIYIGYMPGAHSMVAGSLLTLVGYQALFFGLFAKIVEGKKPIKFLTLERGAALGVLILIAGLIWTCKLMLKWTSGGGLPLIEQSIVGLVLIVLGLQTFFSSFMLSIVAGRCGVNR